MKNLITAEYERNGSSVNLNQLGMREMQQRVYEKSSEQYILLKAPPASGKSRALMYVALEKLRLGLVKKVIVAVPERSIGKSFASAKLTESGFHSNWEVNPAYDLCSRGGDLKKTTSFQRFIESDEQILICTHSTLRFAYDQEQIGSVAFNDCLLAIDEFHHVSSDVENKLGELLRNIMSSTNANILAMTGSYFRGDTVAVLLPKDEAKFSKVTYNYYEQLNGYQYLKTLGIGFHFYKGRYLDAIDQILDVDKKTIIHIPNVNASESTKEKMMEVDVILDLLGDYSHTDNHGIIHIITSDRVIKVADLVNDEPSERERVISYLREVKNVDDVDIVIALGMAKEGFDWPFCETTLTVGYRGSLTEIIQIIGRCTRDSINKNHAQFTNLIAEPDADSTEIVDSVNNILKAIAASLLMEEVIAPKFNFKSYDESEGEGNLGVTIRIKGFKTPTSQQVKDIIKNDLQDLKATIIQNQEIQNTFPGTVDPIVLNTILIPKIIKDVYPHLDQNEVNQLSDYVVAGSVIRAGNIEEVGNNKFIAFSERLVNVDELSMDLINTINPFQNAFEVMSKQLNSKVFKAIQQCIQALKVNMTDDEARYLWPKINEFYAAKGRSPSLDSIDPLERRMAEALVYLKQIASGKNGEK